MKLSVDQQVAIQRAVRPLHWSQRDAFLAALRNVFFDRSDVGDGELYQILRELQDIHRRKQRAEKRKRGEFYKIRRGGGAQKQSSRVGPQPSPF
jgi:hypothetical protein